MITTSVTHSNIPFDLTLGAIEVQLQVSHTKDKISFELYSKQGQLLGQEIKTMSDICAALAGRTA